MQTILDRHQELYLEQLSEKEKIVCHVFPLKSDERRLVPDRAVRYSIEFTNVSDYFVLQEVIEAALGNKYLDDNHLTECLDSQLSKILQINEILGDDTKHLALRTAHCTIHVFTSEFPQVAEIS